MSFNPNLTKKAQEAIFSGKLKKVLHHSLVFNNVNVSQYKSKNTPRYPIRFKIEIRRTL